MFKYASYKVFICKTDPFLMKKFEELLIKCKDTILPVEYQKMVAQDFSNFLPLINGISKGTIIDFLKLKHADGFRTLGVDDLKILLEIYDAQIRNKEKGFFENEKEKNDDLIVGLMSSIKYEVLLKLENPEALYLYNQLAKETQKLDEKRICEILVDNPSLMKKIDNQTEMLQLATVEGCTYSIQALEYINEPVDKVLAILLTQCPYDNPNFKDKFSKGVPDSIIYMVFETKPLWGLYNDNGKKWFGREVTEDHIDFALNIKPEGILALKANQLTEIRVVNAVTRVPSLIKSLGEKFNIYSSVLAKYAQNIVVKMPVDKQEEEMKAVIEYQNKVDEIIKAKENLDANDIGYSKTLTEMHG